MRCKPIFILLILHCFITISYLNAQDLNALRKIVNDKDKKIVEKATEQMAKAGELTKEANDYYNEALALQSNYELDEMTLQKKLASVEKKAIATQIKADKEYTSAYTSIYEICDRMLKETSVTYGESGGQETTAKDLMDEAKDKRKESENSKNPYEQAGLLNSAAELEGAAIDMLIVAVQVQSGSATAPEPTTTSVVEDYPITQSYADTLYEDYSTETYSSTTQTEYADTDYTYEPEYPVAVEQKNDNLAINQQVIGKYDTYVNDPTIPEPVTITRAGLTGVDEVSMSAAKSVIAGTYMVQESVPADDYYTESYEPAQDQWTDEQQTVELTEPTSDYSDYAVEPETDISTSYIEEPQETIDYSQPIAEVVESEPEYQYQPVETVQEEQQTGTYIPETNVAPVEGINFRVQIAASKIPLTRSQLAAIYSGNKTIEVQHVGSWYKYNITGFRLFSEANRVALESGVKDAWVTSEKDGAGLALVEARNMIRTLETDAQRYGRKVIEKPNDFYVQVLASRIRIDNSKLPIACSGGSCREVIEEGWIKYQVYAGSSYQKAVQVKAGITDESFIVAYDRGSKQNLYKAINKN